MNPNGPQPTDGGYTGGGDPSGWGAVAGLLGGFYDTTVSSETARKNTDKTIQAQKDEAAKAYQRQVEMWHLQNAYNSPAEQMKRFGAAGLNPNLIYGQGSSGNANKFPEYQAPNLQYRYEAPQYGAATTNALQELMQVGTWMQNMRLSEKEIATKEQMLDLASGMNPRRLQEMENKLSFYDYQLSGLESMTQKGRLGVADMAQEYRNKWGEPAVDEYLFGVGTPKGDSNGLRKLQYLEQLAKTKIAGAKSSWTDYNITDPQSFLTMLATGVMGLTGQAIRINQKARPVDKVRYIGKGQRGRWSIHQGKRP